MVIVVGDLCGNGCVFAAFDVRFIEPCRKSDGIIGRFKCGSTVCLGKREVIIRKCYALRCINFNRKGERVIAVGCAVQHSFIQTNACQPGVGVGDGDGLGRSFHCSGCLLLLCFIFRSCRNGNFTVFYTGITGITAGIVFCNGISCAIGYIADNYISAV